MPSEFLLVGFRLEIVIFIFGMETMKLLQLLLIFVKIFWRHDIISNPALAVLVRLGFSLNRLKNIAVVPDLDQIELTHEHGLVIPYLFLVSDADHAITGKIDKGIFRNSIHIDYDDTPYLKLTSPLSRMET